MQTQTEHQRFDSFSQDDGNQSSGEQNNNQNLNNTYDKQKTNNQTQTKRSYNMQQITFPNPQQKTLQLYQLYSSNSILIRKLTQEITRLQQIKKQNLYLAHDVPYMDIDQQTSQFYLKSRQAYTQRQQQLAVLKQQYKKTNTQQMRTVVIKNENVLTTFDRYLDENRRTVYSQVTDKFVITLNVERNLLKKKKVIQKQKQKQKHLDEYEVKTQLSKRSQSNDSSGNKDRLKSSRLKGLKGSSNGGGRSSSSTCTIKHTIRFIKLSRVFDELYELYERNELVGQKLKENVQEEMRLNLCLQQQQSQIVLFSFDTFNSNMIILLQSNVILVIKSLKRLQKQQDSQKQKQKNTSNQIKITQRQIQQKLNIGKSVKILFMQAKKSFLYVATSDYVFRVYQYVMNNKNSQTQKPILNNSSYKLHKILSYFHPSIQSSVSHFTNVLNNDNIYFMSNSKQIFRLSLTKYFIEKVYHNDRQKIKWFNQFCVYTQKNIYCIDLAVIGNGKLNCLNKKNDNKLWGQIEDVIEINKNKNKKKMKDIERRQGESEGEVQIQMQLKQRNNIGQDLNNNKSLDNDNINLSNDKQQKQQSNVQKINHKFKSPKYHSIRVNDKLYHILVYSNGDIIGFTES